MKSLLMLTLIIFGYESLAIESSSNFDKSTHNSIQNFRSPDSSKTVKKLIKKAKYKEALEFYDSQAIKESHIGVKIIFDTLNAVINKEQIIGTGHAFLCYPQLREYPNAVVFSMEICKLLIHFREHGEIPSHEYKKLEKFILQNNKNKKFLLKPLGELIQ